MKFPNLQNSEMTVDWSNYDNDPEFQILNDDAVEFIIEKKYIDCW